MTDHQKAIRSALLTAHALYKDIPHVVGGGAPMHDGGIPEGYADGGAVDPSMPEPQKTVKAYKLFRHKDGKLYPLFVNANQEVPIGKWLAAEAGPQGKTEGRVKSKLGDLAYRPGWHSGDMPVATHIGSKSQPGLKAPDTRPPEHVWAEVEHPADVDWQSIAHQRAQIMKSGLPNLATAHITDQVPHGGFYRYKTNPNMTGNWLISGGMKVNRVLPHEEVQAINKAHGVFDLPRREPQAEGFARGGAAPHQLRFKKGGDVAPIPQTLMEGDNPARIDTRLATGAKPMDLGPGPKIVDMPSFRATPPLFAKNVDLLRAYPNVHKKAARLSDDKLAGHFIGHVKDNLLWLHDQVPEEIRNRSKLWYDGANKLAKEWAGKYGVSEAAAAGALAALSPQKDWFQNVSLAERVLNAMKGQGGNAYHGFTFSPEMEGTYRGLPALNKPENEKLLNLIRGRSLGDIDQHKLPEDERAILKALWIRVHDQTHNSPSYRIAAPEGTFGDVARNANGSESKAAWGSLGEIAKAVQSIQHNGDPTFMNRLMGERHKVRNFYNNILDPNSRHGDVTIDTHAVAAGLLRALSGNSKEVAHNFGNYAGKGVPAAGGSAATGIQGTYPLYADAYRRAAAERGILPREMQSITWEAIRGMFPDTFKNDKNNAIIDSIWREHQHGRKGIEDVRNEIHNFAGGIRPPEWFHGAGAPNEQAGNPGQPGELPQSGVRGPAPAGVVGGTGNGPAGAPAPQASRLILPRASGGLVDQALRLTRAEGGNAFTPPPPAMQTSAAGPRLSLTPQGLYSQAGAAASALPQAKGSPQQMLASLKGIKPEEVRHSGAAERFGNEKSVSREELAKHFHKVLPKIQETRLSKDDVDIDDEGEQVGHPQYEDYSLPNGQNYRELLMHLPEVKAPRSSPETDKLLRAQNDTHYAASQHRLKHEFALDPAAHHSEQRRLEGEAELAQRAYHEGMMELGKKAKASNHYSGHWDTPNVLAHLRMSDRYDPTSPHGDKMLHLEELQSDWGQQGREGKNVPKGPHVGTTNGWVDLGLKRALVEAARNGHTRLAWTPGQEQADRYGLQKKLSKLVYQPEGGNLRAFDHAGKPVVHENDITPDKLASYVGKELAERLHHPDNTVLAGSPQQFHTIEGDDLKMGGEGMKGFYDKLVPGRLKEILKKLGHEAQFEPVTITHGLRRDHKAGKPVNPEDLRSTLHSVRLPEELREKILKEGLPAFADGGVVERALRITARPAKMYAAGGKATKEPDYDVHEDNDFLHVARRNLAQEQGISGGAGPQARGPGSAAVAGGAGPLGNGAAQPSSDARLARLQAIADSHAKAHGQSPVVDSGNSESSLHKQSAIGRAFQLAATGHPGYEKDVFEAYQRQHPELVQESGAHNYHELKAAAYKQLAKEVKHQFDTLPVAMRFHREGKHGYPSSAHMRKDVLENGKLAVFRGGDKHEFLHNVHPQHGLTENEMFRAIHDVYGHALHGSGFGAKGEERAWNAHRQMFSPLAALAMSAETRGQNSFVNYTPINAQLTADKHAIEAEIAGARRRGDKEGEKKGLERKRETMEGWQYAPQKAVLLPPEMNRPDYEGGMPDYVQKHVEHEPGTGFSSPITHYSPSADVKELDPSRYGTGIPGDERARVLKRPGGVKERAYGYLGTPQSTKPEPGLGSNAFVGQAHGLYDLTSDPIKLGLLAQESNRRSPLGNFNPGTVNQAQAMNDVERMAKEHGYSGVANPKAVYPMAAMFNKTPVQPAPQDDTVNKALQLTAPR